ncbi:MAG TPA: hypothetical protein VIN10_04945, partial [Bacteroidales bacterium]
MTLNKTLTRANFWAIAINSTVAYLLASIIVFYVNHVMTIIGAALFGFDLSFNYNTIYYHVESYEWSADSVKLIFSAGPIIVLIIGFVSMIFFSKLKEDETRFKILLLWIGLIAFNHFFGGLVIGNLFKNGVGHVFNWMYLKDTEKMAIALFGIFCLVATALLMARPVAMSTNSYINNLNEDNFPFIITAQIIVPFLLGTVLSIAYHFPNVLFQERYSWISLAAMLVIIVIRINNYNTIYFDEETRKIKLVWLPVLFTLL